MDKISPLRAGLAAINNRLKLNKSDKTNNVQQNSTNPFGISFKGTLLQMDVFESKSKNAVEKTDNSAKVEKFEKTVSDNVVENSKADLTSSSKSSNSFMGKVNGFMSGAKELGNNIKQSTISFCGKVKDTFQKLANTEVTMDLFGNSTQKLAKRPVVELEDMFKAEVARV